MIYSYFDFSLKNSSFQLPYQRPSSSADCARELFKGSNGLASLVDCTQKNFLGWEVRIFCEWRHKLSSFGVILAHIAWPRVQPPSQSVSLKLSLETRLESESAEPLINFRAILVQKLWSKINKLINYLISLSTVCAHCTSNKNKLALMLFNGKSKSWTEDAVWRNRFPLNNINACWFLLLVHCAQTVLKLKIWVDKNRRS